MMTIMETPLTNYNDCSDTLKIILNLLHKIIVFKPQQNVLVDNRFFLTTSSACSVAPPLMRVFRIPSCPVAQA